MESLKGCRILLVDDDPDTADLNRYILTSHGAHVIVAASAEEALAALAAHPIDVLMTDISLPEVDGFELLDAVRSRRPGLPAIAVSAHAQPHMKARALAAGFLDYVTKPAHPVDLVRAGNSGCAAGGPGIAAA